MRPGETVAIVGPSGAGKSTIFSLILRFYDPRDGSGLSRRRRHRLADPKAVRGRASPSCRRTSPSSRRALRDNIAFGRPGAAGGGRSRRRRATRLPTNSSASSTEGYDTQVGERGVTLSGGQRQRIAIARAILRDAPVLLLDEATSALDAESETLVQTALERLMRGRTTIVIAHRLATVLKADRILVMEAGRIVEEGTHQPGRQGRHLCPAGEAAVRRRQGGVPEQGGAPKVA